MEEIEKEKRLERSPHRNKEYWRDKVEEWERSNESQKVFCTRLGIKVGTFTHWRGVFSKKEKQHTANKFIAVKVAPSITRQPEKLTIELPSGHKIIMPLIIEEMEKVFNLLGLSHD